MKRIGIFLAAACLALAACADGSQTQQSLDAGGVDASVAADMPEFSGPYKDDLEHYYLSSKSEFFRNIIADQWVSDEEYWEAQSRAKQCLEDLGFTKVEYFPEGGSTFFDGPGATQEEMFKLHDECEANTGLIETEIVYGMMRRNPDNVDWPSAERDCLVREGLLPEGASVADMNAWYESGDPAASSAVAYQCSQDALGHLSTGSE